MDKMYITFANDIILINQRSALDQNEISQLSAKLLTQEAKTNVQVQDEVMNCFRSLRLGNGACEKKDLGINQLCDIAAKQAHAILNCINRRTLEAIIPFYLALFRSQAT